MAGHSVQPFAMGGFMHTAALRVAVIAIPCDPKWRTEKGLELAGPKYFGYDVEYVPVEKRYA